MPLRKLIINTWLILFFFVNKFKADIYEEVSSSLQGLGLDTECLGGGRIEHDASEKRIKVYGYSQGYGKADHAKTKELLSKTYANYNIEWTDEGY
jgi:phosphohistidine phosphatase